MHHPRHRRGPTPRLRTATLVLALAPLATLLTPAVSAGAADGASAILSGTVLLPGGQPAPAAVVDVSLAGGPAFSRGVSGTDGTFTVFLPPTLDLTDLPPIDNPPPVPPTHVNLVATINKLVPVAGGGPPNLVKTVRDIDALIQRAVDETGHVVARIAVPQPVLGALPTVAGNIADALRVYQDPDLILGYDDANDPDLIPPLGAAFTEIAMSAATDPANVAGPSPLSPVGQTLDDVLATPADTGDGNGCTPINTQFFPEKGQPQPYEGIAMRVVLQIFRCPENDIHRDYYALKWSGFATNDDAYSPDGTWKTAYYLWRLKMRTNLDPSYGRTTQDPTADIKVSDETKVTWSVGFDAYATGSISGNYTVVKAKKIHPWSDTAGHLYHVSWISNNDLGSRGAQFWDGGGNAFVVPQGEGDATVIHKLSGDDRVAVWRCARQNDAYGTTTCDPNRNR